MTPILPDTQMLTTRQKRAVLTNVLTAELRDFPGLRAAIEDIAIFGSNEAVEDLHLAFSAFPRAPRRLEKKHADPA